MFANQQLRQPRCRRSFRRAGILTVLLAAVFISSAAEPEPVRNLRELRQAVQSRQRSLCDVNLEAVVCAADSARGLLVLQDATGVDVCALNLDGREFQPGERLRIVAPQCELIRRKWSVALATAPVVDNGGVHAALASSGRITLTAGLHPVRLHYFNVENPASLAVSYTGPGIPPQLIPSRVLFLETNATAGARQNGLQFFCYDDTPETLDKVRNQTPIHTGVATNFDISLRRPEQDVAMQFRGLIEISEPGEYVFTVESDDGTELYLGELKPEITVLSTGSPPVASPPSVRPTGPAPSEGAWQTFEGTVIFVGKSREGVELEFKENSHSIRVWLPSHEDIPPALLLNAKVRATGAYHRVLRPDDQTHSGLVAVVGSTNLRVLGVAPEQWRKNPLTTVTQLTDPKTAETSISHLRGTVAEVRPGGEFTLQDSTGQILVRPLASGRVTRGTPVQVLGHVVRSGAELTMNHAFIHPVESAPSELPVFTTAAQVQQLSARDAAGEHPVTVRGVITCLVEWGGAVVQDATRGVFFSFETSYRDGLEPGDFAEIRGVTAVGDFAPIIAAQSIQVLGPGQMPEPVRPSWNQLISGSLDSQYVEVRGVVTEATGNRITLLTDSGKIKILLHNTGEAALKRLLNTLVRIRGCLLAVWDSETRQVRVGEIRFRNPTIEIDQLPMADPFAAPEKLISDLLLFDLNASGFECVKIAGQIVHARGGELFLMQEGKGLRFRLAGETELQAGDLVEVVGIPELSGLSPRLHEAVARKLGAAPLPPAVSWATVEHATQSPDAIRVETEARLLAIHRTGQEWIMELQAGLRAFRARVQSPDNLANDLPLGSRLHVAGVYAAMDGERNGDLTGFDLLLNSSADIRLLQRPPWWTLRRLFYIVASLVAVLAAAAIWINQLRRQVAQRTQLLEREHTRRERAERERALEVERSRIARDLHDDLGSSLTEIRVIASSGLRMKDVDQKSPPLFSAITEKARGLIDALDVIVWAVDPESNSLHSLTDYLSGYASDYLTHSNISCRFRIPATLPSVTLDGRIRHDLFLAVKEILHNVVQHSRATEVEFQLTVSEGAIKISISDNGAGFEVEGMKDGHGLKNISGRLNKIGGNCQMESLSGVGTKVSIALPLPASKADESARL